MISVSIQLGPGSQPGVEVRRAGPDRLELRGRLRRPWLHWAALAFGLCAVGQLETRRDGSVAGFVVATVFACAFAAALFVRRRLTLDRATRTAVDGFGLAGRLTGRAQSLAAVRRVRVRVEQTGGEHAETRYPVVIEGDTASIELDRPGTWEAALPVAEAVARFLGLELRDDVAAERKRPGELDVAWRDRGPGGPVPDRPRETTSLVLLDRPTRLRARIPVPSPRQIAGLNVLVGLFCLIPFTAMVLLPLLGGRLHGAGPIAWALAQSLFPILLVGSASLLAVFGNGGLLDVTPARLRLVQNGLLWRREVVMPAGELEDLVCLDPELGGARSLLAYFSHGVLVARSDRASVRFGYGLPRPELDWLRARVLEVLRASRAGDGDTRGGEPAAEPAREAPWLIGVGAAGGALAGAVAGGPLAAGVALPFLEHVLNLGAALGALLGAGLDPGGAGRNGRRLGAALAAAAVLLAAMAALDVHPRWQPRPSWDEQALLGGRADARDAVVALGYLPSALLVDAALVQALLYAGFWRSRRRATAGLSPTAGGGALALRSAGLLAALTVAALASKAAANPRGWDAAPRIATPRTPASVPARPPLEATPRPAPEHDDGVLAGRMTWAGRPVDELTSERPRFWFRDEEAGALAQLHADYDPRGGRFRIFGAPGRYYGTVTFGPLRSDPGAALVGGITFDLAAGVETARDLALHRVMRLRVPEDSADHPGAKDAAPELASPVRFAWDPVPGATAYRYEVQADPAEDAPRPAPVEGRTTLCAVELPLPRGRYQLRLEALGPGGSLAHLEVFRPGFRAWRYAFVVR